MRFYLSRVTDTTLILGFIASNDMDPGLYSSGFIKSEK
jgi:hypothetical protein